VKKPLFLIFLISCLFGCQSTKESSFLARDVNSFQDKRITMITLKNGDVYTYDKTGGRYYEEKTDTGIVRKIVGFGSANEPINFDLSKIIEVKTQTGETDGAGTLLAILLGGTVLAVLIIILAFSSGGIYN
jgi:hypothetical protein